MLIAFILLYFSIYFHCSASIPYLGQKAKWLYQERKFPGTFAPGNKTFIPGSESSWDLSFLGAKVPTGNLHSKERKYREAWSPDTDWMCTSIFLLSLSVIFHVWLPNSTTGWTSALNSIIVNIRGNSKRFHKLMSRNRLLLPVMCTPHYNLGLRLRTQGSRLWCGTIIRYGFRVDLSEKCTTSCFYIPSNILDKQQYPLLCPLLA